MRRVAFSESGKAADVEHAVVEERIADRGAAREPAAVVRRHHRLAVVGIGEATDLDQRVTPQN